MNVIIALAALMGIGALFQWVADDWPDTLSGLFFLTLIGLATWLLWRSGYRGRHYGGSSYQRTDVHVHNEIHVHDRER